MKNLFTFLLFVAFLVLIYFVAGPVLAQSSPPPAKISNGAKTIVEGFGEGLCPSVQIARTEALPHQAEKRLALTSIANLIVKTDGGQVYYYDAFGEHVDDRAWGCLVYVELTGGTLPGKTHVAQVSVDAQGQIFAHFDRSGYVPSKFGRPFGTVRDLQDKLQDPR